MANMSYCRFENTARDLSDCRENMLGELSEYETRARQRLIQLCKQIVEEVGEFTEEDFKVDDNEEEDA